jgi:hypothetical protein
MKQPCCDESTLVYRCSTCRLELVADLTSRKLMLASITDANRETLPRRTARSKPRRVASRSTRAANSLGGSSVSFCAALSIAAE